MNYKKEIIELGEICYNCKKCPLGQTLVDGLDPHVFAMGKVPSDVMFVGEAPGADEVKIRRPLVGRCGKWFDANVLHWSGLKREEIYITNAVLCRPNNNRTPLPGEIESCKTHLDAQICLVNPKLIITLGNVPLFALTGQTGITKKRGKLLNSYVFSDGYSRIVYPMFHPSYCLRGSGKKEMEQDSIRIPSLLEDIK